MHPELKFLDGYSGESTRDLLALEKTHRADSIALAFESAIDQKVTREGFGSLSVEERTVLAVEALEREVNNGGYMQFFSNSSAQYAPVIVDSLLRIGCPEVADLTGDAITALRAVEVSTAAIQEAVEREDPDRDRALAQCDGRFWQYAGSIAGKLLEFIKANRASVRL